MRWLPCSWAGMRSRRGPQEELSPLQEILLSARSTDCRPETAVPACRAMLLVPGACQSRDRAPSHAPKTNPIHSNMPGPTTPSLLRIAPTTAEPKCASDWSGLVARQSTRATNGDTLASLLG